MLAGLDVLNEIWACNEARMYFMKQAASDEDICVTGVPYYVDEFLHFLTKLQASTKVLTISEHEENSQTSKPNNC